MQLLCSKPRTHSADATTLRPLALHSNPSQLMHQAGRWALASARNTPKFKSMTPTYTCSDGRTHTRLYTLQGIFSSSCFFMEASCFLVCSVTFVLAAEHVQHNFLFLPRRTAVVQIILNPFALGGLSWYSVCGVDAGGSSSPLGHINPTQPKVLTHPRYFLLTWT